MTNRKLRNEYALEIAKHLGWKQLKEDTDLWSDGVHNPKYTIEVINRHRTIEFIIKQLIKRNLLKDKALDMLSESSSVETNLLKAILDDIKKQSNEEESI